MLPKPSKDVAVRYIQRFLPEYGGLISEIVKNNGWIKFDPRFYKILENLKITDYAKHYADPSIIPKLMVVAFCDRDTLEELNKTLEHASAEEKTAFIDEWASMFEELDEDENWGVLFPETPEEEEKALQQWELLSEKERVDALKLVACLITFFLITLHQYVAIMVHGRPMTQLVAEAMEGNDKSFVLAVQIDRSVMQSIPYFREREIRAVREGDLDFLKKLSYRRSIPPLQGKIKYPLLYFLFAMLEGMNLLDDLTDKEILNICDRARLDRWQNQIYDVNYVTKRRLEYRCFQKHNSRT